MILALSGCTSSEGVWHSLGNLADLSQEFAKMVYPYDKYYVTGQDASIVTLASLMGDTVTGKRTQTMTVFKDVSMLGKTP